MGENQEKFSKEYNSLSEFEEDAVGQWLKIAKARGETGDSDQVLLTLLVELHKKVDMLTSIIKEEEKKLLTIAHKNMISKIGYEHIMIEENLLEVGEKYYVRVEMPVFPKREIPLFVKALSENVAEITNIHEKDERDWSTYMAARERVMIREAKAAKA
ncbi:MAG TPA: hypothetical protein EYG95_03350 [Campylobacterales bacterium]|nr:hypothetical protein [Campylobacterales bacterium]